MAACHPPLLLSLGLDARRRTVRGSRIRATFHGGGGRATGAPDARRPEGPACRRAFSPSVAGYRQGLARGASAPRLRAAVWPHAMGSTFGLTVSANGAGSAASGSTLSGQSNSQLTVGTASNAVANQWRLLRSAEDPENEDLITTPQTNPALAAFSGQATVVVVANLSQWFGSGQVSA